MTSPRILDFAKLSRIGGPLEGVALDCGGPSETETRPAAPKTTKTIPIGGVEVSFPFQPYGAQLGLMAKIIQALKTSQNALLESPTGSGKTLALLCATLAWQKQLRATAEETRRLRTLERERAKTARRAVMVDCLLPGNSPDERALLLQSHIFVHIIERVFSNPRHLRVIRAANGPLPLAPCPILSRRESLDGPPVPISGNPEQSRPSDVDPRPSGPACVKREYPYDNLGDFKNHWKALSHGPTPTSPPGSPRKPVPGGGFLPSTTGDGDDGAAGPLTPSELEAIARFTGLSIRRALNPAQIKALCRQNILRPSVTKAMLNLSAQLGDYPVRWDHYLPWTEGGIESSLADPKRLVNDDGDGGVLPDSATEANERETVVPTIYYCARTHKQISQVIRELKRNTVYTPRMSILSSRRHACIHRQARRSHQVDEECQALREKGKCHHLHHINDLVERVQSRQGIGAVWDIEDLARVRAPGKGCPFYAMKELATRADIIFCPYNYLIDPLIRKASGIELKGSIVIVDEAHNIEDIARSSATGSFNNLEIELTMHQLGEMLKGDFGAHRTLLELLQALNRAMSDSTIQYSTTEFDYKLSIISDLKIAKFLEGIGATSGNINELLSKFRTAESAAELRRQHNAERRLLLERGEITEKNLDLLPHLTTQSLGTLGRLLLIFENILGHDLVHLEDYHIGLFQRQFEDRLHESLALQLKAPSRTEVYEAAFWCMNPGVIFKPIAEACRSVVLTSGTLSPLDTFMSELQTDFPIMLEARHIIEPNQLWSGVIPRGPQYTEFKGVHAVVNSLQYQDDLGQSILGISRLTPHGVLCFMSSYTLIKNTTSRWRLTKLLDHLEGAKEVFIEPQSVGNKEFEGFMKDYLACVENSVAGRPNCRGAIMFAVYRGKVSEGIDFSDACCRAVINVGIPFPHLRDIQINLKKEYNDERSQLAEWRRLSGREWYSIQAFRAMNQALGRCIRHKRDWGAIVFLETRIAWPSSNKYLSKWVRGQVRNYDSYDQAIHGMGEFMKHWSREESPVHEMKTEIVWSSDSEVEDGSNLAK
ncbi:hypothetical protein H4R33_004105 [Dimargaris cristalligena]|nr:hypothetical protein H4R33_004105 [Dimargaris cristalligena]